MERADHAAQREAIKYAQWWNDDEREWLTEFPDETGKFITNVELDPCDRVARHRAECDFTWTMTDGDRCDDYIMVRTTRRGRLYVTVAAESVCDLDLEAP
jgi:hypothetical protein